MFMNKIRILLVDDHSLVRSGLMKLLEPQKEFQVVGEAGDGEEALALVKKLQPDVVLMDLSMPKMSGLEATKLIGVKFPNVRVLVLTMHENEEYVFQILKAGAGGYILKDSGRDELVKAIQAVARGEKFFSSRISEIMVQGFLKKGDAKSTSEESDDLPLTKREREVLAYIAEGMNNQQIAEKLFISPRTVDTHRTNIMQKLDIHDTANLVRFAIEQQKKK
jgi:two-component system response regulator NreC